jgi:hypothetical protein
MLWRAWSSAVAVSSVQKWSRAMVSSVKKWKLLPINVRKCHTFREILLWLWNCLHTNILFCWHITEMSPNTFSSKILSSRLTGVIIVVNHVMMATFEWTQVGSCSLEHAPDCANLNPSEPRSGKSTSRWSQVWWCQIQVNPSRRNQMPLIPRYYPFLWKQSWVNPDTHISMKF